MGNEQEVKEEEGGEQQAMLVASPSPETPPESKLEEEEEPEGRSGNSVDNLPEPTTAGDLAEVGVDAVFETTINGGSPEEEKESAEPPANNDIVRNEVLEPIQETTRNSEMDTSKEAAEAASVAEPLDEHPAAVSGGDEVVHDVLAMVGSDDRVSAADATTDRITNEECKESEFSPETDPAVSADFVNHGLALWEKSRREWLGVNRGEDSSASARAVATPLDVDEIIDVIFSSSRQVKDQEGPRYFPEAVPLPQMVDILQDLWEAEGLDA